MRICVKTGRWGERTDESDAVHLCKPSSDADTDADSG